MRPLSPLSPLLPALLLSACNDQKLGRFNSPPEAAITSHLDGDSAPEGYALTLRGSASDPNDAAETLRASWYLGETRVCDALTPSAEGLTTCSITPGLGADTITLEVWDPDGASASDKVTLQIVPTDAPQAAILAPLGDERLYADQKIAFQGRATDAEDPASALTLSWKSDLDGPLALDGETDSTGLFTGAGWLGEGEHALSLTVTDTSGKTGVDQVIVQVGPANRAPSCAITSPEDGGAAASGTNVVFAGLAGDPDQPAETLTARWSSSLDGLLGAELQPDADGSLRLSWPGLQAGTHRISLVVEDERGAVCSQSITWTTGTPPTVSILRPTGAERVNQGASALFQGQVGDAEEAASALSLRWTSSLDGELSLAGADSSGLSSFTRADLSPGLHIIQLSATDSAGLSATASATLQVNQAPTAPEVAILPAAPTTADELGVSILREASDLDGDAISYSYTWTRDGVRMSSLVGSTVPASETARGQRWAVEVSASDGLATGPAGSAEVLVGNSAPALRSVSLSPSNPGTNDTLSVLLSGSDADGDDIAYSYLWTVNGARIAAAESTLSGLLWFDRGDRVAVTVTPSDGTDSGSPMSSASVIVQNSAPTAPVARVEPADPIEGEDDLLCELATASADADGDPIAYSITWQVGSSSFPDAITTLREGDTVPAEETAAGEVWTCTITPDDGADSGPSASDSVTIGSAEVDYNGLWDMGTTISHSCAYGLVSINFRSWLVSEAAPSISLTSSGSGQPGTMSGAFTSDTSFEVSRSIPGTCTETYTVSGTFIDDSTLRGTLTASFSGGLWCFGCSSVAWDFTARR